MMFGMEGTDNVEGNGIWETDMVGVSSESVMDGARDMLAKGDSEIDIEGTSETSIDGASETDVDGADVTGIDTLSPCSSFSPSSSLSSGKLIVGTSALTVGTGGRGVFVVRSDSHGGWRIDDLGGVSSRSGIVRAWERTGGETIARVGEDDAGRAGRGPATVLREGRDTEDIAFRFGGCFCVCSSCSDRDAILNARDWASCFCGGRAKVDDEVGAGCELGRGDDVPFTTPARWPPFVSSPRSTPA